MKHYVAYYRVSTKKQGASGLGLEAQQAQVKDFIGTGSQLVGEYIETESGAKRSRPQLNAALAQCKKDGATLIVAKLDRLSRSLSLLSSIMDSKTDFQAADNPHANKFTLHILGAVAEFERDQVSARTKAALAAAKARGVKLGTNGKKLARANREAADSFAEKVRPSIEAIQEAGHTSVRAIAEELNKQQVPTSTGAGRWHVATVQRVLRRL